MRQLGVIGVSWCTKGVFEVLVISIKSGGRNYDMIIMRNSRSTKQV